LEQLAKRPIVLLVIVLLVVLAAYANAPLGGFVWDDRFLIETQTSIHDLQPLHHYFGTLFFNDDLGIATRSFYRPLVTLSFAIDWQIWNGNPAGFHLTNLLLHLVSTALVFGLAREAGVRPTVAAITAALFGTFPRLTEAATWISGRTDLMAGAAALASVFVHHRFRARPFGAWLSAALLTAGLFSKEVALAALPALMALEVAWLRAAGGRITSLVGRLAPAALGCTLYAVGRLYATLNGPPPARLYPVALADRPLLALEAIGHYVWALLDPLRPRTQIGLVGIFDWSMVALGAVAVGAICALAPRLLRRQWQPLQASLVLLGVSAVLPVLHFISLPINVVAADRFLYVPAASLAIGLATLSAGRAFARTMLVALVACLATGTFVVATHLRNEHWLSELALWEQAVATTRGLNPLPYNRLGYAYLDAGDADRALATFVRARELELAFAEATERGDTAGSIEGMARSLAELERYEEAIALYRQKLRYDDRDPGTHLNLAITQARALHFAQAQETLQALLRTRPGYEDALSLSRRLERLAADWTALPRPDSGEPIELTARRAEFFSRLGRAADARAMWRRVRESETAPAALKARANQFLNDVGGL